MIAGVHAARTVGYYGVFARRAPAPMDRQPPQPEPQQSQPSLALARPVPIPPRELTGRLAGLPLHKQVLVLAVWPFLEQLLNFLVGFVDVALAGHLAERAVEATNAVGVAAYVGWLIGLVQSAVGVGSTALIARAVGSRHKRLANATLGQSMLLALVVGLGIGLIIFALARPIAQFTRLQGQSLEYCVLYLRIIAAAAPFSALLNVGAACLRGAGDTRTPFWVLVLVNLVNSSLSIALVMAPAPIGGHGVLGIAAGTFVAWLVGAAVIAVVLAGGWGQLRLRAHRLRPHWHTIRRLSHIGVPNLVETFFAMWVANFIVIRIVGLLGDDSAWAAHVIAVRVEGLSYMPAFAMGIAAATLVGQYLGAGDPQRARRAALMCWAIGAVGMTLMGLLFIFAPEPLCRLVTNKPELLEVSPTLLMIAGPVQLFFATAIVLGHALRGAGDTKTTLWLTAACTYLVRLPAVYLLAIVLDMGLIGVWLGLCGELVVRGLVFGARFMHGGWMRVKV